VIGYLLVLIEWVCCIGDFEVWCWWWNDFEVFLYYFMGKDNIMFYV